MPDVSFITATEPLLDDLKVVSRHSVEMKRLAVYGESGDAHAVSSELKESEAKAVALWARGIKGARRSDL